MAVAPLPTRTSYLEELTAEIRILIRAIVGDGEKDLAALQVPWLEGQERVTLTYPHVVAVLAEAVPSDESKLLGRIGKLQAIRDALMRMTKPATGLSIAYTSLVTGNEGGKGSESTYELAQRAFGGLGRAAATHRWFIRILALISVLLAIFAAWEATKASLGKSLLQVLEPLRVQQSVISGEKFKLELSIDKSLQGAKPAGDDSTHLPICARYLLAPPIKASKTDNQEALDPIRLHQTPEVRELCGRDEILAKNFVLAHQGLSRYLAYWPGLVGGLYTPVAHSIDDVSSAAQQLVHLVLPNARAARPAAVPQASTDDTQKTSTNDTQSFGDDVEFWVAPIVQVITSYILPFIFGVIGSLLYVILQHYNSVRTNTLIPRDQLLAFLRIILGIVVAACVSLLITASVGPAAPIQPSPSGSTSPGSLVGSLTLSASLITFLAGFGAEAVFTLLQTLVQRVFDASGSPSRR